MNDNKELLIKIQQLRSQMHSLIEKKNDLLDSEIIGISRKLDELISEYSSLINNK